MHCHIVNSPCRGCCCEIRPRWVKRIRLCLQLDTPVETLCHDRQHWCCCCADSSAHMQAAMMGQRNQVMCRVRMPSAVVENVRIRKEMCVSQHQQCMTIWRAIMGCRGGSQSANYGVSARLVSGILPARVLLQCTALRQKMKIRVALRPVNYVILAKMTGRFSS
jgi:hypothetical protein